MSHWVETRQLEYLKHRSSVIKLVLDLLQELGPHLNTGEYLVDQPLLKRWSITTDELCASTGNLLPIENVCRSMFLHKPYIIILLSAVTSLQIKYWSLSRTINWTPQLSVSWWIAARVLMRTSQFLLFFFMRWELALNHHCNLGHIITQVWGNVLTRWVCLLAETV